MFIKEPLCASTDIRVQYGSTAAEPRKLRVTHPRDYGARRDGGREEGSHISTLAGKCKCTSHMGHVYGEPIQGFLVEEIWRGYEN